MNDKFILWLYNQPEEKILEWYSKYLNSECPLKWTGSSDKYKYHTLLPLNEWCNKLDYYPFKFKIVKKIGSTNYGNDNIYFKIIPELDYYPNIFSKYTYDERAFSKLDNIPNYALPTNQFGNEYNNGKNWCSPSGFILRHFHYDKELHWEWFKNICITNNRDDIINSL